MQRWLADLAGESADKRVARGARVRHPGCWAVRAPEETPARARVSNAHRATDAVLLAKPYGIR